MRRISRAHWPLVSTWRSVTVGRSSLSRYSAALPRSSTRHFRYAGPTAVLALRPGSALNAEEALRVAEDLIRNDVPYVMLCGGEPLVVPHFLAVADRFGRAGVQLKIETNGQRLDAALVEWLAGLSVRSVQISLDGDTQAVYARQRPGASLQKAHAACRSVRTAGLPLEVTFAPTRLNIHEARAVIERATTLGAFRLNTGRLMP